MLTIKKLVVGQLKTNCYLVIDQKTKEVLVIDPGDDGDYITKIIVEEKLKPVYVVATHAHFDHVLASYEVATTFDIPFLLQKKDNFLLAKMTSSAKHFLDIEVDPPAKVNKFVSEGDKLKVGNSILEVMETPGHTPGSISLYSQKNKIVFSGDLIFAEGQIGRTDFSYSKRHAFNESIKRILSLPNSTSVYAGHGSIFKINAFRDLYKRSLL